MLMLMTTILTLFQTTGNSLIGCLSELSLLLITDYSLLLVSSDGETFISADDLRINLWNLEISNQSFNIVDVKPANMEDLTGENAVLIAILRDVH